MNTAVPRTRCGLVASRSSSNALSGISERLKRLASSARPRFHVVISANIEMPITVGTQPPSKNLSVFARKNGMSTERKSTSNGSAFHNGHFQLRVATKKKTTEVIDIAPVTAMPYAAVRLLDFWKITTSARQATISA